jgi:hypothetical protein
MLQIISKLNVDFINKHDITGSFWTNLMGYKYCLCKGGDKSDLTNLTRANLMVSIRSANQLGAG